MSHHTAHLTTQGSPPPAPVTEMLPVPPQHTLTPEQVRGAHCVWCPEPTPLPADALALGLRQGHYMGVYGPWYPRACDPCTRRGAARVLAVHVTACTDCARLARVSGGLCPDGEALRQLAEDGQ